MSHSVRNRFVVQLITINTEIKTYEVLELLLNSIKSPGNGEPEPASTTLLYCCTLQLVWSFFLLCFTYMCTSHHNHNSNVDFLLFCLLQYSYRTLEYNNEYESEAGTNSSITPFLKVALTLLIAKETKIISWFVSSKYATDSNNRDSPAQDVDEDKSDEQSDSVDDQISPCLLNETEIREFYYGIPFIADIGSKRSSENIPYNKNLEIDPYQIKYPKGSPSCCEGFYSVMKPGVLYYPLPRPSKEATVKTPKAKLNKEDFKKLLIEVKTMIDVGYHDNIVQLIGVWTRDLSHGRLLLITEYCGLGSMYEYMQSNMLKLEGKNSILLEVQRWLYEIASGLLFLHNRNVIHGSLSTRKVLLTKNYTVKLSEFGIAPHLFPKSGSRKFPPPESWCEDLWPWRNLSYETLAEGISKKSSDCWSYGITSWEILTLGSIPFAQYSQFCTEFCKALKSGMQVKFPPSSNDVLRNLLISCLNTSPKDRPTSKKLLSVTYQLTKPKRRKLSFHIHPEPGIGGV